VTLLLALAALLATAAAAYCALADGALLAVEEDGPPPPPVVAAVVARKERAHRALAFGRIVAQVLAGAGAAAALKASGIPAVQLGPLVVVAGILIVVLAESGARAAGDLAGPAGVARHARGIQVVERLMRPVVALGEITDRALDSVLPAADDRADREASVEQFREVVAAEAGVSQDDERLLRGVFSLGDTTVQDIMVPRVDVVAVRADDSWAAVVAQVRASAHSRYLVAGRDLDDVIGVLNAKDLLSGVLAGREPPDGWRRLVRPAQFIPATKPVDDQLRDFKASRQHLAVVADEFGGTAGIVTLEDALEVIVGDIRDEHDVEEADVRRDPDGAVSVSARLPIADLAELVGSDVVDAVGDDDVHTVGGLVYARAAGTPRVGDAVAVGRHRLVVERMHRRRIVRVRVLSSAAEAAD
jgi:CBS domain containing-hemolysin-like protein